MFNCANPLDSFRCSKCTNYETYKLVDLKEHAKADHTLTESIENLYECQGCRFHTHSKYVILRHQLIDLCSRNGRVKSEEEVPEENGELQLREICRNMFETTFSGLSKCEYCDFQTEDERILSDHVQRCLDKTPSKSPVNKPLKKRNRSAKSKLLKCEHCSYVTNWPSALKKHILHNHTSLYEIEGFGCKHCSYKSKTKRGLTVHIGYKHTDPNKIRWFECEHCTYKSKSKSNLTLHVRYNHKNPDEIQWFECEHCSFKNKRKYTVQKHIKHKHTDPDQLASFKCEHCRFESKYKASLRNHIVRKHTNRDKIP